MIETMKTTASDLHLCQRCPRLVAWQKNGSKNAWKVGIEGSGIGYGKLFHESIAGAFHSAASKQDDFRRCALIEALSGDLSGLRERLADLIRERYFSPFLAENSTKLTSEQIMALARATDPWLDCLADFLRRIPSLSEDPERALPQVFHRPEMLLKADYPYPDGTLLHVRGKYDCLLFNPSAGEAELFEFKGHRGTGSAEELSQALVYAWLVQRATGVVPAVCLVFLDGKEPLRCSAQTVAEMMANLPRLFESVRRVLEKSLPLPGPFDSGLCGRCPFDSECDARWGNRTAAAPVPTSPEKDATGEGQRRMIQLLDTLRKFRVYADDAGYTVGPCFIRLKIRPDTDRAVTVQKIGNRSEDLQVALALPTPPLIRAGEGFVSVDVPREQRDILTLEDLMEKAGPTRPKSDTAFPLGLDIDGRVFWVDPAEPTMTAILVGGTSGSGKSVLLRSIVVGTVRCSAPGSARFTLIDPKRVTFTDMSDAMNTMGLLDEGRILMDPEEGLRKLNDLVQEMEKRYRMLEKARVSDISGYNARATEPLRRCIILIDEYADLMVGSEGRKELETAVQRIAQKGRAAGIHLILATQRPDAKVVTGVIKANLQLRIALKVMSQTNSQIILDEGGAQYLLGHGDMLVGGSVSIQRLQGALASTKDLKIAERA